MWHRPLACISLAALLAGCGYIGPPLPPALNIPSPVPDLRAIEYGPGILVDFTLPAITTDELPLTSVRSVDLYIGPAAAPFSADAWAATATRFEVPASGPGPLRHEVPAGMWVGQQVTIGVRATGPTGRVSEWSYVILDVERPLDPPGSVAAANVDAGVRVTWMSGAPRHRVMRSVDDGDFMLLGETDAAEYVDRATLYGTRYSYAVVAVAGTAQQSLPSEIASVTPVDMFEPAVPQGLSAVASAQSVELAWARNTEPDFAGYNLFRSVDGGPFVMLPLQLEAPAYSDSDVSSGHRYSYSVVAVDANGNVSARSETAEAAVP